MFTMLPAGHASGGVGGLGCGARVDCLADGFLWVVLPVFAAGLINAGSVPLGDGEAAPYAVKTVVKQMPSDSTSAVALVVAAERRAVARRHENPRAVPPSLVAGARFDDAPERARCLAGGNSLLITRLLYAAQGFSSRAKTTSTCSGAVVVLNIAVLHHNRALAAFGWVRPVVSRYHLSGRRRRQSVRRLVVPQVVPMLAAG